MRHLLLTAALLLAPTTFALAQDDAGLPPPATASRGALVTIDDFGTVTLRVDLAGTDPHIASEYLLLRRSDDGNSANKTLEQYTSRDWRFKDAMNAGRIAVSDTHDQFDTASIPFTAGFLEMLNSAIGHGSLARSTKLAGNDPVKFTLAFDPKGHLPEGYDQSVTISGTLARDASGQLSYRPDASDVTGQGLSPIVNYLVTQLQSTDKTQDAVQSSVILFGTVGTSGALSLSNTTWSCAVDNVQAKTASSGYAVSDDTADSLKSLLANQSGKNVAVRAVLTEGKDGAPGTARVLGVMGGLGWKAPIANAPGGRVFEDGSTLMNLTTDEAGEISSGRLTDDRVAVEITGDAGSDYLTIRAPNRKGSIEPNVGYVKKSDATVLVADAAEGSTYKNVPYTQAAAVGMTSVLSKTTGN